MNEGYKGFTVDPEYENTPYLSLTVNLCSAFGLFIGTWTIFSLISNLHRGLAANWSLILVLALDVIVNLGVRVIRFRRRRALRATVASAAGAVTDTKTAGAYKPLQRFLEFAKVHQGVSTHTKGTRERADSDHE
jgi:hypothetical protein